MIRTLVSGSMHININGGSNNHIPISPGAVCAGMVRFNPNLQTFEVYDGVSWYGINNQATIDLALESKQAIEWANKKMQEEKKLEELMANHPGLREAYDKFEIMKALVNEKN